MFVYMWTNTLNGKKYIGKSQKPETSSYMGSGVYFKRAVKKYGRDVFERTILEYCDTPNELEIAETKWIEHYDAANNPIFYNISPNSGGGHHGRAAFHKELRRDLPQESPLRDERMPRRGRSSFRCPRFL